MAVKDNQHPLVKSLRSLLKRHDLAGAVLIAISRDGDLQAVSAGHDVKACNALGPVLDEPEIDMLQYEMWCALSKS